jgi:hypothetical protein
MPEEDDLDRLLSQYEAQAAQDLQQAQHVEQQRQQPGKQQNATQRREAALEQPLASDNKWVLKGGRDRSWPYLCIVMHVPCCRLTPRHMYPLILPKLLCKAEL